MMKPMITLTLLVVGVLGAQACGDEKQSVDPCAQQRCRDAVVWCYDGDGEANYPLKECPCGCSAGACIDCASPDYQGDCAKRVSCRACTTGMQCGWCGALGLCRRGDALGSNDGDCGGANWRWILADCYPEGCYDACQGYECGAVADCDCGDCAVDATCVQGRCER